MQEDVPHETLVQEVKDRVCYLCKQLIVSSSQVLYISQGLYRHKKCNPSEIGENAMSTTATKTKTATPTKTVVKKVSTAGLRKEAEKALKLTSTKEAKKIVSVAADKLHVFMKDAEGKTHVFAMSSIDVLKRLVSTAYKECRSRTVAATKTAD